MAPKKSITKQAPSKAARSAKPTSKGTNKVAPQQSSDQPSYWLYLQPADGNMISSTHSSADAVVDAVWRWSNKENLDLVSGDWAVMHPRYDWQDAYNVMIPREDFVGDDDELRGFWSKYFKRCMSSTKASFEGEGQGCKIGCYMNAACPPFWKKAQ